MFEMKELNDVLAFANKAHAGQKRKYTGEDYIVHPMRVAFAGIYAGGRTAQPTAIAAALLHDVIEDTHITIEFMRLFLSKTFCDNRDTDEIVRLVTSLTDVYTKKSFTKLNRVERKHRELVRMTEVFDETLFLIKLADMLDNQSSINKHDPLFAEVFNAEYRRFFKSASNKLGQNALDYYLNNLIYAFNCVNNKSIYSHAFTTNLGLLSPTDKTNE